MAQHARSSLLAAIFAICLGTSVPAAENWSVQEAVDAAIDQSIRPAFGDYALATRSMTRQTEALCATPSVPSLEAARLEFGALLQAWGRVEFVRVGPLSANNRLERTLWWPDRRGRGLRQVQSAIASEDPAVADVATLAEQSVAVQGLLALEFALFGTGSEQLATGADHRCAFAEAISGNLANIAGELEAGWAPDGRIVLLWREPSPANPLFRDEDEQLRGLLKLISDGFEIIKVQRLDPFLGENRDQLKPKSAPFWRSQQTLPLVLAHIEGLHAISTAARFSALAEGGDVRLVEGLDFEFRNAERVLSDTLVPVEQLADDRKAYGRLNYVRVVADSIYRLAGARIAGVFGLTSGFSSLDGD